MNDLVKTSNEIVSGGYKGTPDKKHLQKFNEYFFDRNYDAFVVDREVGGNLLYFTLMYSWAKFEWHSSLPAIEEQKFKQLCYRLQMSYRNNFYHT